MKIRFIISGFLLLTLLNCGKPILPPGPKEWPTGIVTSSRITWVPFGPWGAPKPDGDETAYNPFGAGRFMCIFKLKEDGSYLAGHGMAGMFKTTDFGQTWTYIQLPNGISSGVFDIMDAGDDKKHLLATCNLDAGRSKEYGYGIIESFDAGNTWSTTSLFKAPEEYSLAQYYQLVACGSRKDKRLYCNTNQEVYNSLDEGKTWKSILKSDYKRLKELDSDGQDFLMVSGNALLISEDQGKNWKDLSHEVHKICGLQYGEYCRISTEFSKIDKDKLYILLQNQSCYLLEYSKGKGTLSVKNRKQISFNNSRSVLETSINPDGESETIWAGTIRLFKSEDNGNSFIQTVTPVNTGKNHVHDDINDILHDGNKILVCSDGGIDYSLDNGNTWTSITDEAVGLNTSMIFGFDVSKKGVLLGGTQDCGLICFQDNTWRTRNKYGDGGRVVSLDDSLEFMFGFAKSTHYTDDAGKTSSRMEAGTNNLRNDFRISRSLKSGHFYVGNMQLFRKEGRKYFDLLTSSQNDDYIISALYVNAEDRKELWMAREDPTWGGELKGKFFKSVDAGINWMDITENLPVLAWRSITDICKGKNGEVYVSLEAFDKSGSELNKVYMSEDGGNTFRNISTGLSNLPVNCLLTVDTELFCGTNDGVYVYRTGKWEKYGRGLPPMIVTELKYREKEFTLILSSFGRGFWGICYP